MTLRIWTSDDDSDFDQEFRSWLVRVRPEGSILQPGTVARPDTILSKEHQLMQQRLVNAWLNLQLRKWTDGNQGRA